MSDIKIASITDINDKENGGFDDGEIVKAIKGKFTAFFPIKKGEGGNGPYEYQNATFEGADGGKIKVTFSSCTQPPTAKGRIVTIKSVKTAAHGWQGVKVVDDTYEKDGKTVSTRQLRITASAEIEYEGGTPSSSEPQSGQSDKPGSGSQSKQTSSGHPLIFLKDAINLHTAITTLVNEAYDEVKTTDAFRQSAVATLFIEACKQGYVYDATKRLAADLPKTYPPAPKDPKDWKTCVIPNGSVAGQTLEEVDGKTLMVMFKFYDDKKSNKPFAECVYQAARERGLLEEKKTPKDPDLDPADDDIPF